MEIGIIYLEHEKDSIVPPAFMPYSMYGSGADKDRYNDSKNQ